MSSKPETPEPLPPARKGFPKMWFIIVAGFITLLAMGWAATSLWEDTKKAFNSASSKPAEGPSVASNIAPPTAPASAKPDQASQGACVPDKASPVQVNVACCPQPVTQPKPAEKKMEQPKPPIAPAAAQQAPSSGGNQLAWRHPDAEAGKGPRECFFEKVDRSHLERYTKFCSKGILFPKETTTESRTTWTKRVNAEWSEKYRKHDEPRLVAPKELDSVTYKVHPST